MLYCRLLLMSFAVMLALPTTCFSGSKAYLNVVWVGGAIVNSL